MRRTLIVVGSLFFLIAGSSIVIGLEDDFPWVTLIATVIGSSLLIVAMVVGRGEADRPVRSDPARGERLVRRAAFGLAAMGVVAVLGAWVVAVGEARGHAVLHLVTGFLCLGLFLALAVPWHPPAGTATATMRGVALTSLAVAAFGSFLESLGGAGYDAANDGHRIEALTILHGIAAPFAALLILAVPFAVICGVLVLITRVRREPAPI